MKEYKIEEIRNLSLIGHGGVGKTSLAEALLFSAGRITRMGKIEEGSTQSDYSQDEIERQISIATSLLHLDWKSHKLNILDTPGYADFVGGVIGALRVSDGAVIVLGSATGVEVGTETVWDYAKKYEIPRLFFVNQMEKEHADFLKVLNGAVDNFGSGVIPIQLPIGQGPDFKGVIDLIGGKAYQFPSGEETKIPHGMEGKIGEFREKLMEGVAEPDDELIEKYLDKGELTEEELREGLRKGVKDGQLFPLLCGSAINSSGSRQLLEGITDYLPSPSDLPSPQGNAPGSDKEEKREAKPEAPMSSLVFKVISEPHVGELALFRVYSGRLKSGDEALNSSQGHNEKIGQIYTINGKERGEVGMVSAGDMGALVKLKDTHTGDTLCDRSHPICFPGIEFPKPVIRIAIEPKTKGDEERISNGLNKLQNEDPTFFTQVDGEIKQTIISGLGELHLEVIVGKLKRKFGVDVDLVRPKIPYKETILGKAEAQGKYKKQTGGRGQYGDAWLRIESLPRGEGFEFVNAIVGGAIPSKFIPAVEKGIREAMNEGILVGYPLVDFKATLYDGSFHSVDSSDLAFKIAGSLALKKAFMEARPILLEPIYTIEVTVPEEFLGEVMGDLSSRRGKIQGVTPSGQFKKIKAQIPLAELYKYSTSLRSLTQGRGMHTMGFSHYEEVPKELSSRIITEAKESK